MNKHRMLQKLFVLYLNIYIWYIYVYTYIYLGACRCIGFNFITDWVQWYIYKKCECFIWTLIIRLLWISVRNSYTPNLRLYVSTLKNTKFIVKLRKFNLDFTFIGDKRGGSRIMYQSFVLPVSTQCRFEINLLLQDGKIPWKAISLLFLFPCEQSISYNTYSSVWLWH